MSQLIYLPTQLATCTCTCSYVLVHYTPTYLTCLTTNQSTYQHTCTYSVGTYLATCKHCVSTYLHVHVCVVIYLATYMLIYTYIWCRYPATYMLTYTYIWCRYPATYIHTNLHVHMVQVPSYLHTNLHVHMVQVPSYLHANLHVHMVQVPSYLHTNLHVHIVYEYSRDSYRDGLSTMIPEVKDDIETSTHTVHRSNTNLSCTTIVLCKKESAVLQSFKLQ